MKAKDDNSVKFLYLDENDFKKKLRSLKTYCPIAYKQLIFRVKKELLIDIEDGTYFKDLKTSQEFKFIYGQIKLVYSVRKGIIINMKYVTDVIDDYLLLKGIKTKYYISRRKQREFVDVFIKWRMDRASG